MSKKFVELFIDCKAKLKAVFFEQRHDNYKAEDNKFREILYIPNRFASNGKIEGVFICYFDDSAYISKNCIKWFNINDL